MIKNYVTKLSVASQMLELRLTSYVETKKPHFWRKQSCQLKRPTTRMALNQTKVVDVFSYKLIVSLSPPVCPSVNAGFT